MASGVMPGLVFKSEIVAITTIITIHITIVITITISITITLFNNIAILMLGLAGVILGVAGD